MSGVRGYGMPAYSHIQARICPICNRPIKNFEMHTRNREDHRAFREYQTKREHELFIEFYNQHPDLINDGGILTGIGQTAWNDAIKEFGGTAEPVEVKEILPSYAITEDLICPKTGKETSKDYCISSCLACDGYPTGHHPKYHICMELRAKVK